MNENANEEYDYVSEKVYFYNNEKFDILIPECYGKSKIKNLRIFVRNIPTIRRNRKIIMGIAEEMYKTRCRNPVLKGYVLYNKCENSLKNSFKKAITGREDVEMEEYYQIEHQECVDSIIDFCHRRHLKIKTK